MSLFDIPAGNYEHRFVKSNPQFLKMMLGTTDVLPLWIADMDFKVAQPITDELQRLVDRGIYAYEFDHDAVSKTIAEWNLKRHGLTMDRRAFVQVTGVLTGIAVLLRELSNEGDGILVQTPVYHQFYKAIKTANRKIVRNPLKSVNGRYEMDFDDLERKLKTENVKAILLCNPHNPVGRVWNKKELQQLILLANQYGVTIISDEIHSDIVYDHAQFHSIASFGPGTHIAILGSPAKTFGMQSIANGCLYIPDRGIRKPIKSTVESMYLDHGNAFSTFATIAAYSKGGAWVDELVAYLQKTVGRAAGFLQKDLPEVTLCYPEGTYQIWLDFSQLNLSEEALRNIVFNKAKLGLAPGSLFGEAHSQYMRMNIASPFATIQKAFFQLKTAIDASV